jgi:hypothetical protein
VNVLTATLSTLTVIGARFAGVRNPNAQSPDAIAKR